MYSILIVHYASSIFLTTVSTTGMELTTPDSNVTYNSTKSPYLPINLEPVCINLKLDNAEVFRKPKALKVVKCLFSSANVPGERFIMCLRAEGIAMNDPILTDIIEVTPPENCSPSKSMDPKNPDQKKAPTQRLLCLTYVSNKALSRNIAHRFMCKSEDNLPDETDEETLIGVFR